jgi:hypothetical protein
MYGVLTANTPGCVVLASRCSAGTFDVEDSSVFFRSLPGQRSARLTRSGGSSPSGARPRVTFPGTVPDTAKPITGPRGSDKPAGFLPCRRLQRQIKRRLRRQKCSDGPTLDAPDCIANSDPKQNRTAAERKPRTSSGSAWILFGTARRVAFRPSLHPRIRRTVALPGHAICACRATRPPPPRVPKCPTKC